MHFNLFSLKNKYNQPRFNLPLVTHTLYLVLCTWYLVHCTLDSEHQPCRVFEQLLHSNQEAN